MEMNRKNCTIPRNNTLVSSSGLWVQFIRNTLVCTIFSFFLSGKILFFSFLFSFFSRYFLLLFSHCFFLSFLLRWHIVFHWLQSCKCGGNILRLLPGTMACFPRILLPNAPITKQFNQNSEMNSRSQKSKIAFFSCTDILIASLLYAKFIIISLIRYFAFVVLLSR